MAVFRIEKTRDYTVMSNHHLRNTNLSLKAKGLLSLMLSLPENWDYTTKGLAHICKDGVDSICAGVRELEEQGYVIRERVRNPNGQLGAIEYTILEQPRPPEPKQEKPERENPVQANPGLDSPVLEEPEQGNPAQLNTNQPKTDLSSTEIVLEYIKGMKVFKSANMTSTHFTRMSDTLEDIRKTSVQAEVKTAAPTSMYSIIANFLLPFVLLIGSYLFLGGTIASELLVAFMLMSLALSALLIAFEHSYNLLKELKLATSNLEQAFDTKPLSYKEEKVKLSHFDITFENVDFSYNQQADVLHNISFHAPEGSTTALIGPSGSGKSTVANLIARFWDVTKGCVRIGGQDIRELNPDGLLHYISEVFQENTLLSDTIYNNIKAGREDATEQEVIAAAKAAHCHEFIERLPNGYQTHLAEGGNTLSGGEKQRIAIARAILKDAPILLLDESTASLDADNEAKINQALDRLMKGKTVFVIAHRLNTIQNADQIIVLNQGRIEETGTHEELLRKKGHYYEMVQEQQKAREWIVKGA